MYIYIYIYTNRRRHAGSQERPSLYLDKYYITYITNTITTTNTIYIYIYNTHYWINTI